ncbi:MAG TPA: cytochrome c biogenesis protein CcsA, partial [candidate division Zixibacteria bacterium]|nr:cytochrome c biogenesis protein CcsA [candidate division Zixibacteria bacterium]
MAAFGEYCILAAAAAALLSAVLYALVWRGREDYRRAARAAFTLTALFLTGALLALLHLILTHDFRIAYVFSYSSTDLPLWYLVASLWGGQEGTFLLWIVFVAVLGLVLIASPRAREFEAGNLVFVNLFILSILFILLKKSPFEYLPVWRTEGNGLNPLLQNYWMTIHPPVMFVGFAAAVMPAAFAMTALVGRKYDTWAEAARPWTLFAWAALGAALVLGGYWAYETLGWGGFWAWDPVENSSFIPWIFLAAQIHALFIKRQRQGLMRFSLAIVLVTFWSVLYGTFLTRSGVLGDFSVHSFVDLGINNFLLGGLAGFIALGLSLLVWRWRDIRPGASFANVASRSYLVSLGVVVLFLGGLLTLAGTSAPLLTRLAGEPSAVGLSYYFATMTPVAAVVLLLLGLFPSFRWNHGLSRRWLLLGGGGAAAATAAGLWLSGTTGDPLYLALFAAATWALVSNGYALASSWRKGAVNPAYLAHIGLAAALIGAAVSAGFETKQTVRLPQGETVRAMGYDLTFVRTEPTAKGFDCRVEVAGAGAAFTAVLPHEFPRNMEGTMRKPHVEKFLGHDIYLSPLALEQPKGPEPGSYTLAKGESAAVDKYTLTFHEFALTSHSEGAVTEAGARITVAWAGGREEILPRLRVSGDEVAALPAPFDEGRGTVAITAVRP